MDVESFFNLFDIRKYGLYKRCKIPIEILYIDKDIETERYSFKIICINCS